MYPCRCGRIIFSFGKCPSSNHLALRGFCVAKDEGRDSLLSRRASRERVTMQFHGERGDLLPSRHLLTWAYSALENRF